MGRLLEFLFNPPPMPEIKLPLPARMLPGIQQTIAAAFKLAYDRGVYDGLFAGVLLTLLFVPSIRGQVAKGVGHVADHF